jgi:hypothetical protein
MLTAGLLVLVVIIAVWTYSTRENALVLTLQPSAVLPSLYRNHDYIFYQGKDFQDNKATVLRRRDLAGNIPALMMLCDTTPNCIAFSSNGDIKNHVLGPAYLKPIMTTCSPESGIYIKSGKFIRQV